MVTPGPEALAGLLARWGVPAGADLARTERGSNNQTFAVAYGGRRWVLRISQNLSAGQARAEHRLLGRLREAGLPWAPEAGGDLPAQVVHGDVGASNTLVDERTGEVTGLLDFELAGPPLWPGGTPRCSGGPAGGAAARRRSATWPASWPCWTTPRPG